MNTASPSFASPTVVPQALWLDGRLALLEREKQLQRLQDEVARERRALPWVRVAKDYAFDTTAGRRSLSELFEGRRQLLVQHFMLGPGWAQGCPSCSYMADHTDGMNVHLANRGISFVAVSRAPLAEIERFRERMGWKFRWVSSNGGDFNFDYAVSFRPEDRVDGKVPYNYHQVAFGAEEAPGLSVFAKDDAGEVFHTYSTYGRGVEAMMGAYRLIDLTPLGRHERDEAPNKMEWVRHHDRYESAPPTNAAPAHACCATGA